MTLVSHLNRRWGRTRLLLACAILSGVGALLPAATPAYATATDVAGTREDVNSAGVDYVIKTDAVGAPVGTPEAVIREEQTCHVSVGGSCLPPPTAVPASSCPDNNCQLKCQQQPSAANCNYYDPVDKQCDGNAQNAAYYGDTWDQSSQLYLKIWLRWSNECQSNWVRVEMDNDTNSSGDYVNGGLSYGFPPSGTDPSVDQGTEAKSAAGTQCNSQGVCTPEAYGNMLFGGKGTSCVVAWGWPYMAYPSQWWHTKCV